MPGGCPRTKELMDDCNTYTWTLGINNLESKSEGRTIKPLVFEARRLLKCVLDNV